MGSPISHSLSPRIHREFGRLVGREIHYEAQAVQAGDLKNALAIFVAQGGRGANITVPLKAEAWSLARRLSTRAQAAMAANTVFWEDGVLVADNTDGAGLIRDLTCNQGLSLDGRTVLLIGAGGAAQGIVRPLLAEGIRRLVVLNRTPERALRLVAGLSDERAVVACGDCGGEAFDFVINATAAGLSGALPFCPPRAFGGAVAYDLVYGPKAENFLSYARSHGARCALDGLGMLVEQAAESFFLWHGVRPPTAPVLAALRSGAL